MQNPDPLAKGACTNCPSPAPFLPTGLPLNLADNQGHNEIPDPPTLGSSWFQEVIKAGNKLSMLALGWGAGARGGVLFTFL